MMRHAIALAVCALAVPGAWAADAPDDLTLIPMEQLMRTEVISASKMARQISDAPSAVVIVTAEDIRAYGYHTLADIINSMRGLYTTSDRAWQYMGGRGFGVPGDWAGRVMTLIDGQQATDNIYNQPYIDNGGLLDTELIERVEYVPGTGGVTYGNNAFLGIINIVTKKGRDFGGAQVSGEVFSYGGRKTRGTYGRQLDNGANVLASVSALDSDGHADLFFPEFNDPATNNGIAHHLDYESNERLFGKVEYQGLLLEGGYVTRKKGIPTAAYGVVFNAYNQYWDTNAFLNARYDTDLSLKLQSSTHAYYGFYLDRGAGQNPGIFWKERNRGQWWGIDQKFIAHWFEHHTLMLGGEFRDDFQLDFRNPEAESSHSRITSSVYLQDEIALNAHWTANLGARYDNTSDVGGNLSPRLALIYTPTPQTTIKASYSEAYRAPSPYEMYYTYVGLLASPQLQHEHVAATELVLQHEFSPATRLTGTLYHYHLSDIIVYSDLLMHNVNGGDSHTNGAELELEQNWASGIRFRGSTAWQNADDAQNQHMVNSPRNLTKLNLTFPMLDNRLRTGMEVQYTGPRLTLAGNTVSSSTLANLTFTNERPWHDLSASLSIRNLFNHRYQAVAPSDFTQDTLQMDGRTAWLQLTYDFWK